MICELQFLNKLLDTKNQSLLLENPLTEEFFDEYPKEFLFIKNHLEVYGVIPDRETFLSKFPDFDVINVGESNDAIIDALYEARNERKMAEAFNSVRQSLLDGDGETAKDVVKNLSEDLLKAKHLSTIDILSDTSRFGDFIDKCEHKDKHFISTGFDWLDQMIGGWDVNEELGYFAARPNVGKSYMLAASVVGAVKQGKRVGLYSGEMSVLKMASRIDTLMSGISNWSINKGNENVASKYKAHLDGLREKYKDSNICLRILTPEMLGGFANVSDLGTFVERDNLDILFVDQISLLEDQHNARESYTRIANISRDLKRLQATKNIPIIVASQQNRGDTSSGVDLSNVAGSDRVGQDATTVVFIERTDVENVLKFSLTKSRDSQAGVSVTVRCDFDKGKFEVVNEETASPVEYVEDDKLTESYNSYGGEDIFDGFDS